MEEIRYCQVLKNKKKLNAYHPMVDVQKHVNNKLSEIINYNSPFFNTIHSKVRHVCENQYMNLFIYLYNNISNSVNQTEMTSNIISMIVFFHKDLDCRIFFEYDYDPDLWNSNINVLYLKREKMCKLLDKIYDDKIPKSLLSFETEIFKKINKHEKLIPVKDSVHKFTYPVSEKDLTWLNEYLKQMFFEEEKGKYFYMEVLEHFKHLGKCFLSLSKKKWLKYFLKMFVAETKPLYDEKINIHQKIQIASSCWWKDAGKQLILSDFQNFQKKQKDIKENIVNPIKKTGRKLLIDYLNNELRLSEQGKKKIINKYDQLNIIVGWNEKDLEYSYIGKEKLYCFDEWIFLGKKEKFLDIKNHLYTKVVKNEWRYFSISYVNAYYCRELNQVFLPASIFFEPFYQKGKHILNMAGIGSVIGHEIGHGFDYQNIFLDSKGEITEYNIQDTKKINQFANHFRKLYKNHEIDENITLAENMSDIFGLYMSYFSYPFQNEKEKEIFFQHFIMTQATDSYQNCPNRSQYDKNMDTHAPADVRTNIPISVFFSKFFK